MASLDAKPAGTAKSAVGVPGPTSVNVTDMTIPSGAT